MLPGAVKCKLGEDTPSALGGRSVTPAPALNTGTIRPPNVRSASNVTIGQQSSANKQGVTTQPPPQTGSAMKNAPKADALETAPKNFNRPLNRSIGEKGLSIASKSLNAVGGAFGNPNFGSGAIDWAARHFGGNSAQDFELGKQYADGQYGQSGTDRLTQLQWARNDLEPLQNLANDRNGRTGLGVNMGLMSENQADMTNQNFRGKLLQESLKAQQNQQAYEQKAKTTGGAVNFLKDNWKPIAGIGAGLVGLGMLNRSQQTGPQPAQLQITDTGTYQQPPSAYQPFAYRTDSADIV